MEKTVLIDNRYDPVATPATGGMGAVLRCTDTVLKRDVAIKFLLPGIEKRRILDELRALQAVRSPHVVRMYDIVVVPPDDRIGIVQEFVQGQDLLQLSGSGIAPPQVLHYLHQIACGLSDVHAAGIIHRDIKPNNMKLDAENIVKIFDFGLARTIAAANTVGFKGTHGFAAPELDSAGPVTFTTAIDVYAFSCTAIWLLTGGLPLSLTLRPPASTGTEFAAYGYHPQVSSVLQRCLLHDPKQRPTMVEVRDLLRKHLVAGRHRALLTYGTSTFRLDANKRTVNLARPGAGDSVRVEYDNLDFVVKSVGGSVFVNNIPLAVGHCLSGSCLITLGSGKDRAFITFDISHPEVTL